MDNNEIFNEFERHLLQDSRPSDYFYSLLGQTWFKRDMPYKLLGVLESVEQSPKHHPEGNVFIHTMLVLDQAAERKGKSKESRAFMWAALLHDLGKAPTTRIRNGRITAYDHDRAGEGLAVKFLEAFQDKVDDDFVRAVSKLVRWHMEILFVTKNMKFSNLGQMMKETDYEEVALLGLCDRLGRGELDKGKRDEVDLNIRQFLEKCRSLQK